MCEFKNGDEVFLNGETYVTDYGVLELHEFDKQSYWDDYLKHDNVKLVSAIHKIEIEE